MAPSPVPAHCFIFLGNPEILTSGQVGTPGLRGEIGNLAFTWNQVRPWSLFWEIEPFTRCDSGRTSAPTAQFICLPDSWRELASRPPKESHPPSWIRFLTSVHKHRQESESDHQSVGGLTEKSSFESLIGYLHSPVNFRVSRALLACLCESERQLLCADYRRGLSLPSRREGGNRILWHRVPEGGSSRGSSEGNWFRRKEKVAYLFSRVSGFSSLDLWLRAPFLPIVLYSWETQKY